MKKIFSIFVAFLLMQNIAIAQEKLNLEQFVNSAVNNSHKLQNAQTDVKMAEIDIKSAKAAYFPQVNANANAVLGLKNFLDAIPPLINKDVNSFYLASVSAMQPVYLGGKIKVSNDLTKMQKEVNEIIVKQSKDSIIYNTTVKFWNLAALYEQMEVININERLIDSVLKQQADLVAAGLIVRNDMTSMQIQKNKLNLLRTKLSNGQKLALLDLCMYTGIAYDENLALDYNIDQVQMTEVQAIELSQNTTLSLLQKNIQAQELLIKEKQSALLPNVLVGVNAAYFGTFNNVIDARFMPVVMGMVTVPISGWWSGDKHKVEKQKLEVLKAQNKYEEVKDLLETGVYQAKTEVTNAKEEITMVQNNTKLAEDNLNFYKDNYKEGLITVTELLNAQTMLQEMQNELIKAKINYIIAAYKYENFAK